jgi:hypothetical protein
LAAQCVDAGLDKHFTGRDAMESKALVHANGSTVLRSLTSDRLLGSGTGKSLTG